MFCLKYQIYCCRLNILNLNQNDSNFGGRIPTLPVPQDDHFQPKMNSHHEKHEIHDFIPSLGDRGTINYYYHLNMFEISALEEWTQMKFGDILFDSKNDSWSRGKSSFAQKIIGKSDVIFIPVHTSINITS